MSICIHFFELPFSHSFVLLSFPNLMEHDVISFFYNLHSHFRAFSRRFCPKQLSVISSLGFSIMPKVSSTCRPAASNQRPSGNKALALPLIHSCTQNVVLKGNVSYLVSVHVLVSTQSFFVTDVVILSVRQHYTNHRC